LIFGAFGLPFGLFMTVLSGTELFTGNAAMVSMATLEEKAESRCVQGKGNLAMGKS